MKAFDALKKQKIWMFLLAFFMVLTAMFFPYSFTSAARAESFTEATASDSNFSVSMTASSRRNSVLPKEERSVTTLLGEEVTYLCFKWRDLQNFKFKITSNISYSPYHFSEFSFKLTSVRADDLQIPVTEATLNYQPTTESLYHTNITQNKFTAIDFQYYVDSKAEITENPTRCRGNDFGLYKFDFSYSYSDSEASHTICFGSFYVAVLPDDVDAVSDSINPNDIKIFYSVTSSNKLMNVFNLYLSSDAYRYVNPSYLQWNVVGKDLEKYEYVLTQKIKDASPAEYASHRAIWPSLASTTGTNFVFDSNDIEGTWTATCTIKTNNPKKKDFVLKIEGLSTIKEQKTSYTWIIYTCIGVVVVVAVVVALVLILKKRDKIW